MLPELGKNYSCPLDTKITLHEKGLWESEGLLLFNDRPLVETGANGAVLNLPAAHIVDVSLVGHIYDREQESAMSIQVPVTTIDAAADCEATFIKLEIEGSELQALRGARQTIAKNRPKMAISIYHKPEDLETLLDFVLDTDQDYQLGFRQHNQLCPDAMVMYCW